MRVILGFAMVLLTLAPAGADMAPPMAPMKGDDIAPRSVANLTADAEAGRDELMSIIDSMRGPAVAHKERKVTPYPQLPPNPCKSDMTAALRLCVQWVRYTALRMEVATLDLMRAALFDVQGDLRNLERAMREAIEEQKALARGLNQPPARAIPANPCNGWNVTFWRDCVAHVDAALAGNLPDAASAAEIIRSRDALNRAFDDMMRDHKVDERRIRGALAGHAKLQNVVGIAVARAEQAQLALAKSAKSAARRGG